MRPSNSGSGPTPNGNSSTASTKNPTTSPISPPWRKASRRSRRNRPKRRGHRRVVTKPRQRAARRSRRAAIPPHRAAASGWCVAIATRPPSARCAAIGADQPRLAVARRAPRSARRAARPAPAPQPAGPGPAAAAARPTASGTASRRWRQAQTRSSASSIAGAVGAAQRSPEHQRLARCQRRLGGVEMPGIMDRTSVTREVIGHQRAAPQQPAGFRHQQRRQQLATGSTCRCRCCRSATARHRPAGGSRARQTPAARRGGTPDFPRSDRHRRAASGSCSSNSPAAAPAGVKKAAPVGETGAADPSAR